MAVFAVYVEKSAVFQGARRPFGNTYHYATNVGEPFDDIAVMQEVVEAEQAVTSNDILFERAVSWGPTDGAQIDNVMREVLEVNEPGGLVEARRMFHEMCVLIVWPLERSTPLNRRRWLRKYLRTGGLLSDDPEVYVGQDPLTQAMKDVFEDNYIPRVSDVSAIIGNGQLCTAEGDVPTGPGVVRDYLITRQIGR